MHKYPISELDARFEWRTNTTKIRPLFRLMWHLGREYICTCFVEYASSQFYHNGIAFDVLSGVNSRFVHRVLGVHRSFQLLLHFFCSTIWPQIAKRIFWNVNEMPKWSLSFASILDKLNIHRKMATHASAKRLGWHQSIYLVKFSVDNWYHGWVPY